MLNSTVSIAARSSTSCVRMWRPSGRGWTVMPWQPASMQVRAACTTLGRSPPRALRSVAILLRLTLSLTIDLISQLLEALLRSLHHLQLGEQPLRQTGVKGDPLRLLERQLYGRVVALFV